MLFLANVFQENAISVKCHFGQMNVRDFNFSVKCTFVQIYFRSIVRSG